jgi:uncharacterized protein YggT (Ycf19 family)
MQIAHSFLSILAGFIVIVGLTGIATALLRRFAPSLAQVDARADAFAMLVNVGLAFLSSTLGGYVTARYTTGNPLAHAFMLAMVVLLLSAVSSVQMKGQQPTSYLLLLTMMPPLAVLAGALLRLYQLGILHR